MPPDLIGSIKHGRYQHKESPQGRVRRPQGKGKITCGTTQTYTELSRVHRDRKPLVSLHPSTLILHPARRDLPIRPSIYYLCVYLARSTPRQEKLVRPLHPLYDPQLLPHRDKTSLPHQLGQVLLKVDEISPREPTRSRPNQPQELVDEHHELSQIEFVQHSDSHPPLAAPGRHHHFPVGFDGRYHR